MRNMGKRQEFLKRFLEDDDFAQKRYEEWQKRGYGKKSTFVDDS